MAFFAGNENRIKCGRCGTEFDLNKNEAGCPLCGFGGKPIQREEPKEVLTDNFLQIPSEMKFNKGEVLINDESKTVGFWGMVNDFFSGKAVTRICANMIRESGNDFIKLSNLIEQSKATFVKNNLSKLKGFPNDVNSESSVGRLVYHFINAFYKIGFLEVKFEGKREKDYIWNENWDNILIRPTNEGLKFSRIKNNYFDLGKKDSQILSNEEREWIIDYLKAINKKGFKEYTTLKEVYLFIKKGNNGKNDLWEWFTKYEPFVAYTKKWSSKSSNQANFNKQLRNLAITFSSSKVSLLRELGIIKDKRNDYTLVGEL